MSVMRGLVGRSRRRPGQGFVQTGSAGFGSTAVTPAFSSSGAASGPSAAPAGLPTGYKPPSFQDAQWGLDTGQIGAEAGKGQLEFGASGGSLGKDANGNPVLGGQPSVDWGNPDAVKALNPFSRAALLIRSYQQGVQGTSNSYAARGQHSSGAYQRAQNSNQFGFDQGKSGINTALSNWWGGLGTGLQQAQLDAIGRQGPPTVVEGTQGSLAIPGQGVQTIGSDAAGQKMLDQYAVSQGGHAGSIKLAPGWSFVLVNGKPKFIPPGGSV